MGPRHDQTSHEHPHEHPELQRPSLPEPRLAPEPDVEPGQTDLLSLALLVFFVSLIGVVGAMLLVPMLF